MKGQATGNGDGESGNGSLPSESSLNHCPGVLKVGISGDAVPSEEISNLGRDHWMLSSVTCSFSLRAWISAPPSALIPSMSGCLCSLAIPLCKGRYSMPPTWSGSLSCCWDPCFPPALLLVKVTAWLATQRCLAHR